MITAISPLKNISDFTLTLKTIGPCSARMKMNYAPKSPPERMNPDWETNSSGLNSVKVVNSSDLNSVKNSGSVANNYVTMMISEARNNCFVRRMRIDSSLTFYRGMFFYLIACYDLILHWEILNSASG